MSALIHLLQLLQGVQATPEIKKSQTCPVWRGMEPFSQAQKCTGTLQPHKVISPLSANVKQSVLCLLGKLHLFGKVTMQHKILHSHILEASFFTFVQSLCDSVRKLFYSSGKQLQLSEFPMVTRKPGAKLGSESWNFNSHETASITQIQVKKTEKLGRWTFKKQTEADSSPCKLLDISKLVQGPTNDDCSCVKHTWNYSVTEISCLQKGNTEMEARGF